MCSVATLKLRVGSLSSKMLQAAADLRGVPGMEVGCIFLGWPHNHSTSKLLPGRLQRIEGVAWLDHQSWRQVACHKYIDNTCSKKVEASHACDRHHNFNCI